MPDLETIRRIVIEARRQGVDETTAALKNLSAAHDGLVGSSDRTERASLSVERAWERQRRATDEIYRASQARVAIEKDVANAIAQGIGTSEQHAAVLAVASQRYNQVVVAANAAKASNTAYGQATQAAQGQISSLAASTGLLGSVLTTLGPAGLAVGVGIAVAVKALQALDEQAHAVGQRAIELKKFADTTGLTTTQVQALRNEAAKFGLGTEQVEGALQKFTVNFEELRHGSGNALAVLQRYKPELVEQMQGVEETADAVNVLRKAYDGLSTSAQNALSRAFFGKGGIEQAQLFKQLDLGSITQKYAESGRGLNSDQTLQLAKLEIENQELRRVAGESFAKLFASDVIEAENSFLRGLIEINFQLKDAAKSGALWNAVKAAAAITFPGASAAVRMVQSQDPDLKQKATADAQAAAVDQLQRLIDKQKDLNDEVIAYEREITAAGNVPWTQNLIVNLQLAKSTLETVNEEIEKSRLASSSLAKDAGIGDIGKRTGSEQTAGNPQAILIEAVIAAQKRNVEVLGELASVEDRVALKENELAVARRTATNVTNEQTAALVAYARVQAELAQVAPGTWERQLAALESLKSAYPGLTAAQAQAMQSLSQQLALAEAVTGAEKMAVQEAISFANELLKGATASEAMTTAVRQTAIAEAQVNSAAKATLASLKDQEAVAGAVTGRDKIRAQEQATINKLRSEGVSADNAEAVASQERANSEEAATSSVLQQNRARNQSTEMIYAQLNGTEAATAAAQAYSNAIDAGAKASAAAAASASVLAEFEAKAAVEALRMAEAEERAALAMLKQVSGAKSIASSLSGGGMFAQEQAAFGSNSSSQGSVSSPGQDSWAPWADTSPLLPMQSRNPADYHRHDVSADQILQNKVDSILGGGGSLQSAINEIQSIKASNAEWSSAQTSLLSQLYDMLTKQTTNKDVQASKLSEELAWLQQQPETLARDQAISQLTDSIKSLTSATDSLADTMVQSLSDLYTQDPRTSHLGFRTGFAEGGSFVVPGYSASDNVMAHIPLRGGERVMIDPPSVRGLPVQGGSNGGGNQVVHIHAPITINGAVDVDEFRRTVTHTMQDVARHLRRVR